MRTFGEWDGVAPGSLQADLVAHCGESTERFHLWTLDAVDVATGWTELQAVWGKGKERVASAMHHIRLRLPVELREIHTDNGSEFINQLLLPYCQKEGSHSPGAAPTKRTTRPTWNRRTGRWFDGW